MLRYVALGLIPFAQLAGAAAVTVDVRGADGRALPDAVVTLDTPHAPRAPIRFPWPYMMRQQNISFQPHVLIVPVGTSVSFPNMDNVRHHVYSFSKPRKFELKLYGQEQARSVVFDKPGVVALGCNIHDSMSGFIVVVTTPYAGKTDTNGRIAIPDVPQGVVTMTVWSPQIHAAGNQIRQMMVVPPAGLTKIVSIGP